MFSALIANNTDIWHITSPGIEIVIAISIPDGPIPRGERNPIPWRTTVNAKHPAPATLLAKTLKVFTEHLAKSQLYEVDIMPQ